MMYGRVRLLSAGLGAGLLLVMGCQAKKPVPPPTPSLTPVPRVGAVDTRYTTPVPTVPPSTPTPLPTRPIANPNIKATKGKPIGPIITHFGAAKADGTVYEPIAVKGGIPTYRSVVGSGFMIVVEAKAGLSNAEVSRSIFSYDANDPSKRPDLQILSNRDLGDGSRAVCDRRRPKIGGIPGVKSLNYAETQEVSDALNDFACRFEIFIESSGACTNNKYGDFSFINPESATQFCMIVARAWNFPIGTTELSVRLRDVNGNPGPVQKMRILHPEPTPPPKKTPKPTPGPKALPTR